MMKLLPAAILLAAIVSTSCLPSDVPVTKGKRTSGNVLVSGYNAEIARFTLNDNLLTQEKSWSVDPNLTWLEQANGSFWAIHEVADFNGVPGGAVSRWEVVGDGLERQEYLSLQSPGPAHLLVDLEHNVAITANYGGGTVTVVAIESGKLANVVQVLAYGEGCRDASHPHHVVQKGNHVWVVDLGCDAIYNYKIEGGKLNEVGKTTVEAGAGPRHMALHGDLAFVACELKNYVKVFQVDIATGALNLIQTLPLAAEDSNFGAEILVASDMVYASSRGTGVVSAYRIQGNQLEKIQELDLTGTWPRSIAVKEGVMLAADQKGNTVQLISVDVASGFLSAGGVLETPIAPAFVMFYD